jgi:hypothetical protein
MGLYIPPTIWRELDNFSSGSVSVGLASAYYDENDYQRNDQEFPGLKAASRHQARRIGRQGPLSGTLALKADETGRNRLGSEGNC